jgi:hypothetical protein
MNLLSTGAAWLERTRHKYLTSGVWYERKGKRIGVQASIGKTIFKTIDDYGHICHTESRDFLIRATDLIFDSKIVFPETGDRIIDSGFIYEVLSPRGEPHWRYADINRQTLRIHTKYLKALDFRL